MVLIMMILVLVKASFEETPEMFLKAAKHGELDLMTPMFLQILCVDKTRYFGTSSFQVLVDLQSMKLIR